MNDRGERNVPLAAEDANTAASPPGLALVGPAPVTRSSAPSPSRSAATTVVPLQPSVTPDNKAGPGDPAYRANAKCPEPSLMPTVIKLFGCAKTTSGLPSPLRSGATFSLETFRGKLSSATKSAAAAVVKPPLPSPFIMATDIQGAPLTRLAAIAYTMSVLPSSSKSAATRLSTSPPAACATYGSKLPSPRL